MFDIGELKGGQNGRTASSPGWMVAWSRIADLIGAIERQYESPRGNAKLVEEWAKEIQMQCKIIEATEQSFKDR